MKQSPIKKFRINRKKWLRPHDGENEQSMLLNPNTGKMCCLGFYARARGRATGELEDVYSPCQLTEPLPELYNKKTEFDNALCNRLIHINDNTKTSDARKEKAIKNNFKKIGVEVNFYN